MNNSNNSLPEKILLGLSGLMAGGKDTVAEHLVEAYSFTHISTGDLLRAHVRKLTGQDPDRDMLRRYGAELRAKQGADYLVRQALEGNTGRLVVSGLRAVNEARAIKESGGLIVICTAPAELRYKRARGRGRLGDEVTFEQFLAQEQAEMTNPDPNGQNISEIIKMADHQLDNSGQPEELLTTVDDLIRKLQVH